MFLCCTIPSELSAGIAICLSSFSTTEGATFQWSLIFEESHPRSLALMISLIMAIGTWFRNAFVFCNSSSMEADIFALFNRVFIVSSGWGKQNTYDKERTFAGIFGSYLDTVTGPNSCKRAASFGSRLPSGGAFQDEAPSAFALPSAARGD